MALFFSTSSSAAAVSSSTAIPPVSTRFLINRSHIHYTSFSRSKILRTYHSLHSDKITIRAGFTPKTPPLITSSRTILVKASAFSSNVTETTDFSPILDELEEEDAGSPWEGAVVYKRDASVTHLEYCTTLERLGLGKLSTETSKSRASAMGVRLTPGRGGKDSLLLGGTPVLISVDVTRRKRKLKLDGIVRTVITLGCNRCAEPTPECAFSNFSLLLTEEPLEESDEINMGVIFGEDKSISSAEDCEEEEDDQLIDLDDRLYFPVDKTEIDISKNIRDIVHVEITINAVCNVGCKGLCLKCGTNLNKSRCSCGKEEDGNEYGPLKNLKKQMQNR